jgi:hypothetical protein
MVKRDNDGIINDYNKTPDENYAIRVKELGKLHSKNEGPVIFTLEDGKLPDDSGWWRIIAWRQDQPFGGFILEWRSWSEDYSRHELLPDLKAAEARLTDLVETAVLTYTVGQPTICEHLDLSPLEDWLFEHMTERTREWVKIQPMPIEAELGGVPQSQRPE